MRRVVTGLIVACVMLTLVAPALADAVILNVPDWNQPDPAQYPGNGIPAGAYPNWCSPTAGGNLMGYWEDVKGCVGLTDRQAFGASPGYPATPGTWEQGLYHDGMIEMGWHMDTGGWRSPPPPGGGPFPPFAGNTMLVSILPGLLNYAKGAWTDNNYPPPLGGGGSGIVKVAYPNTNGFTQNTGAAGMTLAQMWTTYTPEVDLTHPVEVTFDRWVNQDIGADVTINGQTVHRYSWGPLMSEGHSVVGVGYIDLTPRVFNGDEWFICQDGWSTTPQYVAVPVNVFWQQNDYITSVPEPSTIILLVVGALSALVYGWRRRRRA